MIDNQQNSIQIFADGGSRGNPGPAGIGFVIIRNKKMLYRHSEFIGLVSNNIAEYTAVLRALEWLVKNVKNSNLQFANYNFYLDSQLVVQQLSGNWKIKNQKLREIVLKIKTLEPMLSGKISYIKIPRELNSQADSLVNLVLDKTFY